MKKYMALCFHGWVLQVYKSWSKVLNIVLSSASHVPTLVVVINLNDTQLATQRPF